MAAVAIASGPSFTIVSAAPAWLPSPTLDGRAEHMGKQLPHCAVPCLEQHCASFNDGCLCATETKHTIDRCVFAACTLPEAIFARILTEAACDTPVRKRTGELTTLLIALTPITVLVASLRLTYKQFFSGRRRLNTEEGMLFPAMAVGIAGVPLEIFGIIDHGAGMDVWGLDRHTLVAFQQYFYAQQIVYVVLMLLLKLTIVFFYLNVFFGRGVRAMLWGAVIFHVATAVTFASVIIFQCQPVNYHWGKFNHIHDDSVVGHCADGNAAGWANSAISVASDLFLLAIPLSQLHGMKLHWKKKLGAAVMFIAGTSFTVVSCLRLASVRNYASTSNPTWDQWDILWWSTVEINVGFLCTCLPTMRLILIRLAPQVFGSESPNPSISLNRVSSLGTELSYLFEKERATLPKRPTIPEAAPLEPGVKIPEPVLYNLFNPSGTNGAFSATQGLDGWHDAEGLLQTTKKSDNWRSRVLWASM